MQAAKWWQGAGVGRKAIDEPADLIFQRGEEVAAAGHAQLVVELDRLTAGLREGSRASVTTVC